jgi:hypothetical protein
MAELIPRPREIAAKQEFGMEQTELLSAVLVVSEIQSGSRNFAAT